MYKNFTYFGKYIFTLYFKSTFYLQNKRSEFLNNEVLYLEEPNDLKFNILNCCSFNYSSQYERLNRYESSDE